MNIGVLCVNLRMPENACLKDKRRVLSSITSRIKGKFNVSIAEIDHQDSWQFASVGIVCVSNNGRHADETLSKVLNSIEASRQDVEILDHTVEILSAS
ncbi:MAG: DUF503 domain-containing protein [Dehalococcoidia bacterium]